MIDLWEKYASIYVNKLYNHAINLLYKFSIISYRLECKVRNKQSKRKLTKSEIKKVKNYWKKFNKKVNWKYSEFYSSVSGKFNEKYIPDEIYAGYIDRYYNNAKLAPGIADKNYFDIFMRGFKLPVTYVHYINGVFLNSNYIIISKEEAINILMKHRCVVMKKTIGTSGGHGIKILENYSLKEIKNLINNLDDENFIFQEKIKQNNQLASLNSSSLNTIRIMTYFLNNKIYTSDAIIRVGKPRSYVDNSSSGGVFYRINSNGLIEKDAYDITGKIYKDNLSKINYCNEPLLFMDDVKKMIIEAAQRLIHFKIIAWDICINEKNEPVIIEYNLSNAIPDMQQIAGICVFGKHTDLILKKSFNKKEKVGINTTEYI